ncbi:aminodeoxychorismate/anthranilate synthase component II [Prosthecochloris sp. N3]|uniref:Aminodeoxychorismate/anthranilate synthase component II n=1 Tax=Prosthecochloris ethylica TaxID=2743976 RepID=A0ABR9XNF4_9CHLB|nr:MULTISPECIES: aminodeoxychorismate/anthranilate synthase component II [Prosthecochloris]MEC9487342.1 aminodeoxychorismate/anthranilate synthase component II [Prosthecochloris sp.]MBF0585674.1 aminodeoxychorismate/anthranilate synthase component II [Prosthecochloris ethylica]MBF0635584.1 aminodeoxychorismate/anthranilate synthase component II [Prosthecochloris ethylica]NUK46883.1 aminodeoxychorismate/anthranilate synthase component II [Prosthecochloris ethylica]RNA65384.1 aminodeoxychorismat
MVLVIDNYDSFTYNLVQYMGELGADVRVCRNDELSIEEVLELNPERIVISPGPGVPGDAGISIGLIHAVKGRIPLLGVCLGHQAIGEALGGRVVRAGDIMHGKTSLVYHDNAGIFRGVQNPFTATRYHSLVVERETLPDTLTITAWTSDGVIMGMENRELMLYGVQFHPESIMTHEGKNIIRNFLELSVNTDTSDVCRQETVQQAAESGSSRK